MKTESNALKKLLTAFEKAEERVRSVILDTKSSDVERYKLEVNKKIDQVTVSLTRDTMSWAEKDLPAAFKEGERRIDGHVTRGATVSETSVENAYIQLARNVQHASDRAKDLVNDAIQRAEEGGGYGATVGGVKQEIEKALAEENSSMMVTYSNGAKVPLSSYAEMLARTSRIMTSNEGAFARCRELEIDLVYCVPISNCCPYCRRYEGKVYSISGKDKRFPALYETALSRGYDIMHPNCRHEFVPFVEGMYSAEELDELIKKSNEFPEYSKDDKIFRAYNQGQALLRQYNDERKEFAKMKSVLGEDMPYKTLGSFRRARRAKSGQYIELHRDVTEISKAREDSEILVFYKKKGYNTEEINEKIADLNRQYLEQVGRSKVKDVGFYRFAKTFVQASDTLIGKKTSDDREIKGVTVHLAERIIGTGRSDHLPVPLKDVVDVVESGKIIKKRARDIVYEKGNVRVSFNPVTQTVIQATKMGGGGK